MNEEQIHEGLRVVTNNGRWATVIGRTCCAYTEYAHGERKACDFWDGWWQVVEDDYEDGAKGWAGMQDAGRMSLHGIRTWDGKYTPSYNDPKGATV